mgnify:CR=1 FL=1
MNGVEVNMHSDIAKFFVTLRVVSQMQWSVSGDGRLRQMENHVTLTNLYG